MEPRTRLASARERTRPTTTPLRSPDHATMLDVLTGVVRPSGAGRSRRQPGTGRAVRLLIDVHRAAPTARVVVADGLVASGCVVAAGTSVPLAVLLAATFIVVAWVAGTYADRDSIESRGVGWLVPRLLPGVAGVALVAAAAGAMNAWSALVTAALVGGALLLMRCLTATALLTLRSFGLAMTPTLVLGPPDAALAVVRRLRQLPQVGLDPVETCPLEVALAADDVAGLVTRSGAGHVVVIPDAYENVALATSLRRRQGIDAWFSLVPPLADLCVRPVHVTEVGGIPMISLGRVLQGRRQFPGKRLLDLIVVLPMLVLAAPVVGLAALAIKLDDRGPVLFRQPRVGRDGRTFHMFKLRTMTVDAAARQSELLTLNVTDGLLFKAAGDPRITRVGAVLRRLSVDELPQLWNVLRGDMSMVGPRPLPVRANAFGALDGQRHVAPPGITGYWQVSGGNGLSYDEMVRLDLAYIDNWSVLLDLRLLLRTVPALLVRRAPA